MSDINNPSNMTPLSGVRVTDFMIIDSRVGAMFFADYGIVTAVNGNRVDVQHAVLSVLLNGTVLPVTESHDIELLFLGSAAYSEKFPVNPGDGVLLVGLRNYLNSTAGPITPAPPDVFWHYTQNTMKAIPLGQVTGAGVQVTIDANGKYTLLQSNAAADVELQAQAGLFQLKNTAQSLYTIMSDLMDVLQGITTIPAVIGVPLTLQPAVIAQLAAIKVRLGLLLKA